MDQTEERTKDQNILKWKTQCWTVLLWAAVDAVSEIVILQANFWQHNCLKIVNSNKKLLVTSCEFSLLVVTDF